MLRKGVKPHCLQPQLLMALFIADREFEKIGRRIYVTYISTNGDVADICIVFINKNLRQEVLEMLQRQLRKGNGYMLTMEKESIRIEYNPDTDD